MRRGSHLLREHRGLRLGALPRQLGVARVGLGEGGVRLRGQGDPKERPPSSAHLAEQWEPEAAEPREAGRGGAEGRGRRPAHRGEVALEPVELLRLALGRLEQPPPLLRALALRLLGARQLLAWRWGGRVVGVWGGLGGVCVV